MSTHRGVETARAGRWPLALIALALSIPASAADAGTPPSLHEYTLRTWRQVQGLPQSSITALAQDMQGFLWVGTQKGLARFDGIRFRTFTRDEWPALADNWITALLGSKRTGELWVGTLSGLCVYRQGAFTPVALPGGPRYRIRELAELPGGDVLVGTLEGPLIISSGHAQPIESLSGEGVTASLVAADRIWLGGRNLVELDAALEPRRKISLPPERAGSSIEGLAADGDCLWVGTDHGLLRLDGQRLEPAPWVSLANTPVRALHLDRYRALWVATGTELVRVRPGMDPERFDDPGAPRQVRRFLTDRDGTLWTGSIGFGLTQLWRGRLIHYVPGSGSKSAATWSVAPAGDGLWIGTMDGVARLRGERIEPVLPAARLPHPQIWSMYDDGSTLWIGTRTGIARFDVASDTLLAVPGDLRGLSIFDIVPRTRDVLLIATSRGFYRYETGIGRATPVAGAPREMSFAILDEGEGRTYLGTDTGVFEVGPGGTQRIAEVESHAINSMLRARDGSLLVGSEDAGLFRERAGRWTHFDRSRGLPVDTVYALVPDAGPGVFVVHHQGVYRLSLNDLDAAAGDRLLKLTPEILLDSSPERGGESAECCAGIGRHAAVFHDGALWVTGWGGLLRLRLETPVEPAAWPRPVIERVRAGGKWAEQPNGSVIVPANDRDVTVDFTSPVLTLPSAVRFRYRIESHNAAWRFVEPAAPRNARFGDLPAGQHRFQVETLAAGQETPLGRAELTLAVQPRFRETLSFYLTVAGLAVLVVVAAHKTRVRALKSRQRELQQTVDERTQELHRANETLKDLTLTDLLTGLRNRRFLEQQIAADIAHIDRLRSAEASQDLVLGFLMVDIDHFKEINDRLGHVAGDTALRAFADNVRRRVRQGDYVIRWGGEEFLIIARGVRRADLNVLATQLLRDLGSGTIVTPAGPLQLTCSIGFFGYPIESQGAPGTWEDTVHLADAALYEAKRAGRNRWATYRLRRPPDLTRPNPDERLHAVIDAADVIVSEPPLEG
jgi:diguanylate cyclase (GGDEF)-like protein